MMIVAEISGEHCGQLHLAKVLMDWAKTAGADAVKFQLFDPEKLAALRGGGICNIDPWKGIPFVELYRRTQTPREWFPELFEYARQLDIIAFSSVFDTEGIDYLDSLHCPIFKISSYERDHHKLIDHAAKTCMPLIISGPPNGLKAARYLYCVSEYPCRPENVHLKRMVDGGYDGFSDHTEGITAAVAAASLGAKIIEKHITLGTGLDASFAIGPAEFTLMCKRVREVESIVGATNGRT